jgi:hypothetical protein
MARFLKLCKSNHIRVDINRGATPDPTYTICRIGTINGIIAQQRRGLYQNLNFADAN